jgi:hypothetical protein
VSPDNKVSVWIFLGFSLTFFPFKISIICGCKNVCQWKVKSCPVFPAFVSFILTSSPSESFKCSLNYLKEFCTFCLNPHNSTTPWN